jgi:lipopolysaccharide export system permease protein
VTLFLHLARRALLAFLGTLAAVVTLFLAVEFAESAGALQGEGALAATVHVYLLRAAAVAWQVAPAAMLLAASLTASGLRKTREYDAMRALGLGPWRVAAPLLAVAAAVAVGLVLFDEHVAAGAAARADEIKASRGQTAESWSRWQERKHWFRGRDGRRIYDLRGSGEGGVFERVTILELSPAFRLERRIDAGRMAPGPGGDWLLTDVEERTFDAGGAIELRRHAGKAYRFDEDPEAFDVRPGWPAQMRRSVLAGQVALRRRLGLPSAEFELELWRKIAYPLAAIPASLLALALALRRDRKGFVTASLVESVGVSLGFYALQGLSWSLARSGNVNPVVAAWIPDLALLALGLWALRRWR